MWQYYSYCSINTIYVPVFTFIPKIINYCHYACGSTTVTVRSIQVVYRYSTSFLRYTIIVTIHVAVLQLLFDQYYRYCSFYTSYVPLLPFTSQLKQLLSLYMWQYYSYCSISTRYIPVFPFTSHDIQLISLSMCQYYSYSSISTRYIQVFLFTSHDIQ